MRAAARRATIVAVSAGDAAVLAGLRPDWARLLAQLAHPHAWVAGSGADGAVSGLAGAALWFVAAWLGLGLLAAVTARLPGALGRAAGAAGRVLLPRLVQRLFAGSAGLGVLLAPVSAMAAPAHAASSARPIPASASRIDAPTPLPAPTWPTTAHPAPTDAGPTPTGKPPSRSRPSEHPAQSSRTDPPHSTRALRVRTGDSLWLIAARRLGADASPRQVAVEWPRWYTANHDVVGPDPALIRPGQVLHAPPATTYPEEASR